MRVTLLAITLLILAACGSKDSPEQHLAEARNHLTQNDSDAASIALQNVLQLNADSAEARWLLGKIYLEQGQILEAENQLQRAQKLGWQANDVRPALAKALLAQGMYTAVLSMEHQDLDQQAAALLLAHQARAALSDNQPDKASELIALALNMAPDATEVNLANATIEIHRGKPAGAVVLVENILKAEPDNGEAWWLKGQALLRMDELEDARAAFDQSISHSETPFADRIARALINLQLQDYEAAQVDATELLALSPKDPAANYIQGFLHFQKGEYHHAISALTHALPITQQFPMTLHFLSTAYLYEGELEIAGRYADELVTLRPHDSSARKLLATLWVLSNRAEEAQEILQPVLDQNPDDVAALNIMANALLLDDKADAGLAMYARIGLLQPDWRIIPLRMEANLLKSDANGITETPARITTTKNANFPQTDILLILNLLGKQDFPGAIEAAKSYKFRDLMSLSPYHVLGRVYIAAGQPEEAKSVFKKALKRQPGDAKSNLYLAQLALDAGESATAREYYQAVLKHQSDDLATLLQLATLEAREGHHKKVIAILRQAINAHPDTLAPRLGLASVYIGEGKPQKVAALFAPLSDLQQQSPGVLHLTGVAQLAQNQYESALATLQSLVDAVPDSATYRYLLASAAGKLGDINKARQELRTNIQRNPEHVPSLTALARAARLDDDQKEFEVYMARLLELAPDAPPVLSLRALAARESGNTTAGLSLLTRAFKLAPTSQSAMELAAAHRAAGDSKAAANSLRTWLANNPADVAARLALADNLQHDGKHSAAQAQYLAVLEQQPQNIIALNNLAWSLRIKNPKKALQHINAAINIAPDIPTLYDTLAVIELYKGDQNAAKSSIQKALAISPDDVSMRFHQAMIDAAMGEDDRAIASLEQLLLADATEFPERAEAEALLKKLKG